MTTAQISSLPLRLKIAHLLQSDGYAVRSVREDEIDYLEGIPRSLDTSRFYSHGISVDTIDVSEASGDQSSSYELLVFRCSDRYVVGKVCYPSYSDDECDGQLSYLTQEMDFQAASSEVREEFSRLKGLLRGRMQEVENNSDKFLSQLNARRDQPAIEPEIEGVES